MSGVGTVVVTAVGPYGPTVTIVDPTVAPWKTAAPPAAAMLPACVWEMKPLRTWGVAVAGVLGGTAPP